MELTPTMKQAYRLGDALPPVGTRVEHEIHGPATVIGDHVDLEQWFIRLDAPVDIDGQRVAQSWCYPYMLRPTVAS